ncbi:MAG TPA: hypothetical protein VG318_09555 [Actinomycetota bacterium]|nr:hypothetical protein [Actinomycetota bacterium]
MKKAIVVALTAGLVAGAFVGPADAGKKKKKIVRVERVVEVEYTAPGAGVTTPAASGGICPFADPTTQECIEIPLQLGEAYIQVSIADAAGQTVAGYISQGDTDGDGIGNLYGDFCGAHPEPIELQSASAPVRISFYNGASSTDCPSLATTGTITATFSNLP